MTGTNEAASDNEQGEETKKRRECILSFSIHFVLIISLSNLEIIYLIYTVHSLS